MNEAVLAVAALSALASMIAGIRFLRVAQREHYVPRSVSRFAVRWWASTAWNRSLFGLALLGVALSAFPAFSLAGLACCAVIALGPLGLSLRGRSSKLNWTRRLVFVCAVWSLLQLGLLALAVFISSSALASFFALAVPMIIDVALAATAPGEKRLAKRFVRTAATRLAEVKPVVVAITGSYGKTTTKGHVAHLLGSTRSVLASPASFNNRAGLARAVNENLSPDIEVFVAEMGTFARGEIAELCSWIVPDIAVITSIGPVHLERFHSEDHILEAKAEITVQARTLVLNVDDTRLAHLADTLVRKEKTVIRCSTSINSSSGGTGPVADIVVAKGSDEKLAVIANSSQIASIDASLGAAANIACAVAVAHRLGVPPDEIARLLPTMPLAPHRLGILKGAQGASILDDTYNSNPAGARMALDALQRTARQVVTEAANTGSATQDQRIVLVTPGMVELGNRQHAENTALARNACSIVTDFLIVGRTNRKALLEGTQLALEDRPGIAASLNIELMPTREAATEWCRAHLRPGDVVLFENDLPDHYP